MTRLKGTSNNRSGLILATLLAAVVIALLIWATQHRRSNVGSGDVKTFNLTGQPFVGQESAPVSMVVFEDFKCPNCKNFEESVMPDIEQKYVQTGKVKVYKINYPFLSDNLPTNDSQLAAQAAECAYDQKGNDGYNSLSTILFRAQGNETQVWATKDKLEELAGSVEGLDTAAFKTCLDSDATKARVEADKQQALSAGVNGTPSVFVAGKLVPEFSAANIGAAIDAASN